MLANATTTTSFLQIFTFDDLYPGPGKVEVSVDNSTWILVANPVPDTNGTFPPSYPSADFVVSNLFQYVRITDLGLSPNPYEDLGFDLDAVGVSNVPLPAAAWLFGSAILGLVAVARRKQA